MAKRKMKMAAPKASRAAPAAPMMPMMQDKNRTFSHIMYVLFLISVTLAAFYTFQSFGVISQSENPGNFYIVMGILLVMWSFLFWEFGHRIHQ